MKKITKKEIKVLEELIQGKTNIEISEELGYSEVYIKKMLQTLRKKFNVNNRVKLVVAYLYIKFNNFL